MSQHTISTCDRCGKEHVAEVFTNRYPAGWWRMLFTPVPILKEDEDYSWFCKECFESFNVWWGNEKQPTPMQEQDIPELES